MTFSDRASAGQALAHQLEAKLAGVAPKDAVVVGVPRGGVVVAAEVARACGLALDVVLVRRVPAPREPGTTLAAIGEGDALFVDAAAVERARVPRETLDALIREERDHIARAAATLRRGTSRRELRDRVVVVVDDGVCATATALATLHAVAAQRPRRIILAAPVGAAEVIARVRKETHDVVCLEEPDFILGLGSCYDRFDPVDDDVVHALLERARRNERVVERGGADEDARRP